MLVGCVGRVREGNKHGWYQNPEYPTENGTSSRDMAAVTILSFLFSPSCCALCFLLSPGILSACCSRPLTSWGLSCCHPIWLPTQLSCLLCWVKKLGQSWAPWGWRAKDCCFQSWGGTCSWAKLREPSQGENKAGSPMAVQLSMGDSYCSMAQGGESSEKETHSRLSQHLLSSPQLLSECWLPKCEMDGSSQILVHSAPLPPQRNNLLFYKDQALHQHQWWFLLTDTNLWFQINEIKAIPRRSSSYWILNAIQP